MRWIAVFVCCFGTLSFLMLSSAVFSQSGSGEVEIDARVPGCGDSVIDSGEDCDTLNLNGKSCATQGFTSGTLSCTAGCAFNTSSCATGSGGGGGGGGSSQSNKAQVVLSGRAYPMSTITILKDAQIVAKTIADEGAEFQINVSGLSSGSYVFSLYGEDSQGFRSPLFTFPVSVTKGVLIKIDNIFIAPTLAVSKSQVKKGDPITLFGQSTPAAEVTLEVNSAEQFFVKATTDTSGVYLHNFDSSVLEYGQHHAQSRAALASAISSQSLEVPFAVGDKNILLDTPAPCPAKADLNSDCSVSLVDFSIAAFWYNRILSESFALREKDKLNGDGKINITDFSIMAFYWTG
jgi:hypothetical protein